MMREGGAGGSAETRCVTVTIADHSTARMMTSTTTTPIPLQRCGEGPAAALLARKLPIRGLVVGCLARPVHQGNMMSVARSACAMTIALDLVPVHKL